MSSAPSTMGRRLWIIGRARLLPSRLHVEVSTASRLGRSLALPMQLMSGSQGITEKAMLVRADSSTVRSSTNSSWQEVDHARAYFRGYAVGDGCPNVNRRDKCRLAEGTSKSHARSDALSSGGNQVARGAGVAAQRSDDRRSRRQSDQGRSVRNARENARRLSRAAAHASE